MIADPVATLETLLDRMLNAVLNANLAGLADLSVEAESCLAEIDRIADRRTAQRLRRKAERNGVCLMAAARGLRAAQRRIAEINAAGQSGAPLVTYDMRGRRKDTVAEPDLLTQRF
jgi:hypothetical protein